MTRAGSDAEEVTLVGGFRDGARLEWRGGDVIECDYIEVLPAEPTRSLPEAITGTGTALYRRSLVTRHLFVFQP